MSGSIPLLPLYAFMARTGTTIPLPFMLYEKKNSSIVCKTYFQVEKRSENFLDSARVCNINVADQCINSVLFSVVDYSFNIKLKFSLEQATKAQRGSRGIGWVVNSTPRPLYPRERDPIPIV